MQDLGTLGGTTSSAFGINEAGKVVGEAATSNNEVHAFLYNGGQMQDLGTLGGSHSRAWDINEADKVVGSSTTRGDAEQHTFLYSGRKMRDLGTLEEPPTAPAIPLPSTTPIRSSDKRFIWSKVQSTPSSTATE